MASLIKVLSCPSIRANTTHERFIPLMCNHVFERGLRAALSKIEGAEVLAPNTTQSADWVVYGGGFGGNKLFAADDHTRRCGGQLLLPEATEAEYARIFGVSVNVLTAELLSAR